MTLHTIKPLTRLRKHKLINPILATPTRKTLRVERVVACHHCLVEDGFLAYFTVVAVCADGGAVGEEEEVRVRLYI